MNKCLVTELNGVINDNTLLKVGEFIVKTMPYNNSFPVLGFITLGVDHIEILDNGYFTNKEGTENYGKSKNIDINKEPQISLTASTDKGTTTFFKGARTLKLHSKYGIKRFTGSPFGFNRIGLTCYSYVEDISTFQYSKELEKVEYDMTYMQSSGYSKNDIPYLVGDISVFSNHTNLKSLIIGGVDIPTEHLNWECGITGDISSLGKLTKLTELAVINGKVSGKIEDMLNSMVQNGRKEGVLSINFMKGVTFNGEDLNLKSSSFTFSESGWTKSK